MQLVKVATYRSCSAPPAKFVAALQSVLTFDSWRSAIYSFYYSFDLSLRVWKTVRFLLGVDKVTIYSDFEPTRHCFAGLRCHVKNFSAKVLYKFIGQILHFRVVPSSLSACQCHAQ